MDAQTGSNSYQSSRAQSVPVMLMLVYQSFGVVYGDLAVSPLYVFRSTFSGDLRNHITQEEIYGVLSLIFWTLTLVPAIKYATIVLSANDNGEGGTFALYSLLCRHAKLSLILNQQTADAELSTYKLEQAPESTSRGEKVRKLLEKYSCLRTGLLILVLLGTCMGIGDGILTPSIAGNRMQDSCGYGGVNHAIQTRAIQTSALIYQVLAFCGSVVGFFGHLGCGTSIAPEVKRTVADAAVLVACCILVILFGLQHIGTHRISFLFAPIVLAWLFCNCSIGAYNLITYNPGIVRALSPYYIYHFFKVSGKDGWISLGGVLLSITGSEAMFADLGHFSQRSIKVAFSGVVYPSMVLGYLGQAAYLSKNLEDVDHGFFHSIPKPLFWPVFITAMLVSIVGSQAVITATFSIVKQCHALGFVPWVKVVHTSSTIHGQIYIPEVNWIMFVLSLSVTVGFQNTIQIGNAYGIAVIVVMLVTTFLTTLVIAIVWERSIILACVFFFVFGSVEAFYLSSALFKVKQGGWVSLVLAGVFMCIMYVWHYGTVKKYEFDLQNKVSMKWLLTLGPDLGIVRVPGIGLIYTELVTGVPAIFSHFATNLPAFHQILVFVCVKSVPVPFVPPHERYLVGRVGSRDFRMYRCVVRTGYKDAYRNDDSEFENQLVYNLAEFIQTEGQAPWVQSSSDMSLEGLMTVMGSQGTRDRDHRDSASTTIGVSLSGTALPAHCESLESSMEANPPNIAHMRQVHFDIPKSDNEKDLDMRQELKDLVDAKEVGFAYVMGHSNVKAKKSSSWLKTFAINFVYAFLQRNCRDPSMALHIPHMNLIEVGMMYYI